MRFIPFLPILGAVALTGCGGTKNRGLESVHQPLVSRTDYVYDVRAGGLGQGDRDRLDGWFRTLRIGYGDKIALDDPSGDPSTRHDVQTLAARYGLLLTDAAPMTEGAVAPGQVRVVVSRAKAEVPGCPDWSRTAQPEFDWHSTSNYGCAANATLAMMVADPEDLVRGRSGSAAIDATASGKAIKAWREKAPTGQAELKKESTRNSN